jgi:hypothetical protein
MKSSLARFAVGLLAAAIVVVPVTPAHAAAADACGAMTSNQKVKEGYSLAEMTPSTHAERKAAAEHDARRAVPAATCGGGFSTMAFGQISWMYQYAQVTNYFCGPAVVSEFSATVPGSSPYNLDQWTVANYMGTTANGTSWSQEVNGLNHFVGVPDFGWNYYGMAWVSDPPTAQQQTDFYNRLVTDVGQSSPIAGLAFEVPGGPHLVGHPVNQQIGHWIEIGGYNTSPSQVWYADSATSVWSSVPRYSWIDMYTMEVILGGAGYIW